MIARESLINRKMDMDGKTIDEDVDDIERRMVEDALKIRWNKQMAAQEIGLRRQGGVEETQSTADHISKLWLSYS